MKCDFSPCHTLKIHAFKTFQIYGSLTQRCGLFSLIILHKEKHLGWPSLLCRAGGLEITQKTLLIQRKKNLMVGSDNVVESAVCLLGPSNGGQLI